MGRSVSYASGSLWVLFCSPDGLQDEDESEAMYAWEDFKENLTFELKELFPSLGECDKWLDREDHAVLENRHCYIGLSEYCGLVSVWCVPKETDHDPLSRQWIASIEAKAAKAVELFATRYRKLGSMSNGEGVYEKVAA